MEVGAPLPKTVEAATKETKATSGVRKGVPKKPVAVPASDGLLLLVLVALVARPKEVPAILVTLMTPATTSILAMEATDVVAVAEAPVQGRTATRPAVIAEDTSRLGLAPSWLQVPVTPAAAVAVPQTNTRSVNATPAVIAPQVPGAGRLTPVPA